MSGQARDALPLLLWHLGRKGGGPRYTLELAKSLIHRDDVRLSLALSRQSDLYEETAALGLPTLGIDTYQSAAGFAASVPRLPLVRARLGSFVRAQGARIALCSMVHLWNPLLVGALKRNGAKNVLVVHDAAPHPGDEHLVRGLMLKNDFRQADLLVSLTDQVGQRLVAQQGIRSEKIIASTLGPFRYRGASPVAPKTLGTAPFRLLFFGRLLPYKGLDLLIGAMALLAAEAFPVTLRLVGQGPQELGPLPANIELRRGWVAEAAIPGLFEDIDLVVLPYREASQSGVLPIAQDLAIPGDAGRRADTAGRRRRNRVYRRLRFGRRSRRRDPRHFERSASLCRHVLAARRTERRDNLAHDRRQARLRLEGGLEEGLDLTVGHKKNGQKICNCCHGSLYSPLTLFANPGRGFRVWSGRVWDD